MVKNSFQVLQRLVVAGIPVVEQLPVFDGGITGRRFFSAGRQHTGPQAGQGFDFAGPEVRGRDEEGFE